MVLNDIELKKWAGDGGVSPFDPRCINPASIDLRWSGKLRIAKEDGWTEIEEYESYTLMPGSLYLMDTMEYLNIPEDKVGMLYLKSSLGRMGLEHLHAGWFDCSFSGSATLEIKVMSPWPIKLEKGQRIVQIALMDMNAAPAHSYKETGRYNGQNVPQVAR